MIGLGAAGPIAAHDDTGVGRVLDWLDPIDGITDFDPAHPST